MEAPLFSLVILVSKERHLLPLTLDTLKLQSGSFEVVLLNGAKGHFGDLAHRYPQLSIRVQEASSRNLAEMMNEGVHLAQGKYIQFLEPGDRYISQHGLAYLEELIQKNGTPHLIYFKSSLMRGGNGIPRPVYLDLEHLQKGTAAVSPWFLKEKVVEAGGFDRRLLLRPTLDLLCRLFRLGVQVISSPRVLTDFEPHQIGAFGYTRETCRILYRHFGLWSAFKWMFVQDHSQAFNKTAQFLKQAFWKDD